MLRVYRRLPTLGRRWVVRTIAPSFTVGAMAIIERADGSRLFVRHVYRTHWGVRAGCSSGARPPRSRSCARCARGGRLRIQLLGEPAVVVDADPQRVDIVFRARPIDEAEADRLAPSSPEISDARWFPPNETPELQHETAGALVVLARSARAPQAPPIP